MEPGHAHRYTRLPRRMLRSRQVGEGQAQADVEEDGAQDHARHQQARHALHDACAPTRNARSGTRAAGTSMQPAFLLSGQFAGVHTLCSAGRAGQGQMKYIRVSAICI